jgi:hypothetical protein
MAWLVVVAMSLTLPGCQNPKGSRLNDIVVPKEY